MTNNISHIAVAHHLIADEGWTEEEVDSLLEKTGISARPRATWELAIAEEIGAI